MKDSYDYIRSRIDDDPTWFDSNGVPRYNEPRPDNSPNVYAGVVVFMRVGCQACPQEFIVELNSSDHDIVIEPEKLHYGDPPAHGCVGDTMNSIPRLLLSAWDRRSEREWIQAFEDVKLSPKWWNED